MKICSLLPVSVHPGFTLNQQRKKKKSKLLPSTANQFEIYHNSKRRLQDSTIETTVNEKLNADKATLIKLPAEDHACKRTTHNRPKAPKSVFEVLTVKRRTYIN